MCYFVSHFLSYHHNTLISCIFTLRHSHNSWSLQTAQSCPIWHSSIHLALKVLLRQKSRHYNENGLTFLSIADELG